MPYSSKQDVIDRARARSGFSEREPGYGGVFGAKVLVAWHFWEGCLVENSIGTALSLMGRPLVGLVARRGARIDLIAPDCPSRYGFSGHFSAKR